MMLCSLNTSSFGHQREVLWPSELPYQSGIVIFLFPLSRREMFCCGIPNSSPNFFWVSPMANPNLEFLFPSPIPNLPRNNGSGLKFNLTNLGTPNPNTGNVIPGGQRIQAGRFPVFAGPFQVVVAQVCPFVHVFFGLRLEPFLRIPATIALPSRRTLAILVPTSHFVGSWAGKSFQPRRVFWGLGRGGGHVVPSMSGRWLLR